MKTKTNKNYCVYAVAVSVNGKNYIYFGSGDKVEPARRRYDFINGHRISKKAQNLKGNYWEPSIAVLHRNLTKKQAVGVENELIGIFNEDDRVLNEYAAKTNGKYGKNKKLVLYSVVQTLNSLNFLSNIVELDDFKGLGFTQEEIHVMKTLVDLWNSLE